MERLHYRFNGGHRSATGPAQLVGVVGSGNLEVLIEAAPLHGGCEVSVSTSVRGYDAIWEAVVADFFARHALADISISINDNGATPAIVALRLDQAVAEFIAAAGVHRA
jgi:malonate decarboxylase delta subunit